MDRFSRLNIGAGKTFDLAQFSGEIQKAITDGIADAATDLDALMKQINSDQVSSSEMFGTRAFLKNNYLYRYAGAKLGLYVNSGDEAIYLAYFVDANQPATRRLQPQLHFTICQGPTSCRARLLVSHHV